MTDNLENSGPADDMVEYLQTFLDETEEQLDDLVETLLALERDATNPDDLNEAFRLIHSIKGSAGMMGLDNITVLTHHLENRFERFRSGVEQLNEPTMNLVLRCIDFLRQCTSRLRDGGQLGSATELLEELRNLEAQSEIATEEPEPRAGDPRETPPDSVQDLRMPTPDRLPEIEGQVIVVVQFRAGLPLSDLKARLVVSRLSGLGDIKSTQPDLEQLADTDQVDSFQVWIETVAGADRIRAAADVDGIETIDIHGAGDEPEPGAAEDAIQPDLGPEESSSPPPEDPVEQPTRQDELTERTPDADAGGLDTSQEAVAAEPTKTVAAQAEQSVPASPAATLVPERAPAKVTETMRVDIDRLDNLMNLTGELVVNRARFVQISESIHPELRNASMLNRLRDFNDTLRRMIDNLEKPQDANGRPAAPLQQLRAGLALLDEQSEFWDNGRRCFSQLSEAIDQLSRVSHSLQRGVLETRMVPVGPLFNRFKRVVRDLSQDRGKIVALQIRGEKTELDKRMIDELGDPLVHLVRNSIDHGLEAPDVRVERGKAESGTIFLEASHSGNNVYIHVRDDGGGIDCAKIQARLVENGVLTPDAADCLTPEQALEFIWHPGFSTAREVTDVSGRGVGMDVVKTRINQLNGTIDVDSNPQGTTFSIRLPLTLAIINSLLVRMRDVIFSMPMDDVREIVSLRQCDVVTVQGKQTFDVRGEFIPLVTIEDVFDWHDVDYGHDVNHESSHNRSKDSVEVVILQSGGRTMGLRVDQLLGSQDIVIKSLSDNFIDIPGLSGASILGDGSVCLMLDVGSVMMKAIRTSRPVETLETAT